LNLDRRTHPLELFGVDHTVDEVEREGDADERQDSQTEVVSDPIERAHRATGAFDPDPSI
jgi:hypothetical protein